MYSALAVIVLGILTAIFWGFSDFFSAKAAKKVGSALAVTMMNFLGAFVAANVFAYYLLDLEPSLHYTLNGMLLAVSAGFLISVAGTFFFMALRHESVSIVSPLSSTYPLVTVAIALFIFKVHLTSMEIVGILLAIGGILGASGIFTVGRSVRRTAKATRYSLLAALAWGLGYALLSEAMKATDPGFAAFISLGVVAGLSLVFLPFIKGNELINAMTIRRAFSNESVALAAFTSLLGNIALFSGFALSTSSGGTIITAVSACYPILTIFLAVLVLRDRVKLTRIASAIVGVAGIALLSI